MKFQTLRANAARLVLVAVVGIASMAAVAPAGAQDERPTGRSTINLPIRTGPSIYAERAGRLAKGTVASFDCKVNGTSVRGQRRWYKLVDKQGWVAAKYIQNTGPTPNVCLGADRYYGIGTAYSTLVKRNGPFSSDARRGTFARGDEVYAICYAMGERVGNTRAWYYLTDGTWVPAYSVVRETAYWGPCAGR